MADQTTADSGDSPHHEDHPELVSHNVRVGLWLFAVYVALYGLFTALNAFYPAIMAKPWLGGVNLAVGYGVGLILAAFVMALIYMALCSRATDRHVEKHRNGSNG